MEKLELSSTTTRAKLAGTIISISGAFVVTFYKGPSISTPPSSSPLLNQVLDSARSDWIIGSLFLTVEYILVPVWYILVVTHPPQFKILCFMLVLKLNVT